MDDHGIHNSIRPTYSKSQTLLLSIALIVPQVAVSYAVLLIEQSLTSLHWMMAPH